MLRPKVTTLPGHIQAVYVQNVVKLYASILQRQEQAGEAEAAQEVTQLLVERLPQFVQSADLEVQERVSAVRSSCLARCPAAHCVVALPLWAAGVLVGSGVHWPGRQPHSPPGACGGGTGPVPCPGRAGL